MISNRTQSPGAKTVGQITATAGKRSHNNTLSEQRKTKRLTTGKLLGAINFPITLLVAFFHILKFVYFDSYLTI